MNIERGKSRLRAEALARRRRISGEEAQSFAFSLAKTGLELAGKFAPSVSAAYLPLPEEASTVLLLEALAERNFCTALPVTPQIGKPLVFRAWRPGDLTEQGKMGILEPLPTAAELVPDLLFVPLAAFDRAGNRLGYGGGYYDRTLAKLRESRKIFAIGIGYACQEVEEVPVEAHDQQLDFVLTEAELIAGPPRAEASLTANRKR
jgi:5-formyltetrahydrofolate cyclo-ligase